MRVMSVGPTASLRVFEWDEWLYQLVSAAISGGAGAASSAVMSPAIDPVHFNPTTWAYYKLMGLMFLGSAIFKACIYLSTHGMPNRITTTTTTTTETKTVQDSAKSATAGGQ